MQIVGIFMVQVEWWATNHIVRLAKYLLDTKLKNTVGIKSKSVQGTGFLSDYVRGKTSGAPMFDEINIINWRLAVLLQHHYKQKEAQTKKDFMFNKALERRENQDHSYVEKYKSNLISAIEDLWENSEKSDTKWISIGSYGITNHIR